MVTATDLTTRVRAPFAEVLAATRAALGRHGFGVITEIDLQATFRQRLEEETAPYVILGACQPRSALRATRARPEIGLLLPCNVVVYAEGDAVRVSATDPDTLFRAAGEGPGLAEIAAAVRGDLAAAIAELAAAAGSDGG